MDDWELNDVWLLTSCSEEAWEGSTCCHVRPGGDMVQRRIGTMCVPLRWVGAISQVQLVHIGMFDHQAVMTMFTPEYLHPPPRTCLPTWMLEDKWVTGSWTQKIPQHMPPFPDSDPGHMQSNLSGMVKRGETNAQTSNLAVLRDIQLWREQEVRYA